jgi:hypothetical protein
MGHGKFGRASPASVPIWERQAWIATIDLKSYVRSHFSLTNYERLKPDEGGYEPDFADSTGRLAELDAVGRGNVDKKSREQEGGNRE